MTDVIRRNDLFETLGILGSDLARWPADRALRAREALLSDPEFRQAWDTERSLDRALSEHRRALDGTIGGSGALGRVRRRTLARLPDPLAAIGWQRIAAAVLVAGMLGGAMSLFLAERAAYPTDYVMLDPLFGLEETELQ